MASTGAEVCERESGGIISSDHHHVSLHQRTAASSLDTVLIILVSGGQSGQSCLSTITAPRLHYILSVVHHQVSL